MFKQILLTVATTILTTGIGLNFTSNIKLQENIERQNVEIQSDNQINYWFNNDHSDKALRIETIAATSYMKTHSEIFTINFGTNDPSKFLMKKQAYTSDCDFVMHWGKEIFNYNNELFWTMDREIKNQVKVTSSDEMGHYMNLLMKHKEKSFLAVAEVVVHDGYTYYYEKGNFYVQWLIRFQAITYSSFSSVFSKLSLGSNLLFERQDGYQISPKIANVQTFIE